LSNRITVAISTFRESYIGWVIDLLKALETQTIQDFEIVVVVNDNHHYYLRLANVVKRRNFNNRRIILVFNPNDKGIANARNIALYNSHTPYIAYTDDDAIPHSQWLEELLFAFKNEKIGSVTGPVICKWEKGTESFGLHFPRELNWIVGCTPWTMNEIVEVRNGVGSNLAFRRDILLKIQGFNENYGYNKRNPISGEESEIGIRMIKNGYVTLWNPKAIVYHRIFRERLVITKMLKRSFIEGKTKGSLSKLYGNRASDIETEHLKSIAKTFIKTKSFQTRSLLVLTTIAVFLGYFSRNSPKTSTRFIRAREFEITLQQKRC